jgi:hypothetical protein
MTTLNNLAELKKYVDQIAKQAMNNGSHVKKTVIEKGKQHVQSDVYDVYTPNESNPKAYKRTGELKENWKTEPTADGMAVFNDRRDEGRYVAEIVETGKGYQYDFPYNGVERPFTKNTADELRDSNELTEALKKDLKSLGIDSI